MMERLAQRAATIGARHAAATRASLIARLEAMLPGDVLILEEGEAVMVSGRRIGIRWLRDRGFAALRDGLGRLL